MKKYALIAATASLAAVSTGASAAYWVASPARTIAANAMAMVGSLGTFTVTGSTLVVPLSDNANEYVIADAIPFNTPNWGSGDFPL